MHLISKYWILIAVIFCISIFIKPVLCFLILGTSVSYIGFAAVIFLHKITRTGISWMGNIVGYQSDNEGHKTPIIEFTTITGDFVKEKPLVYTSTDLSKLRTYGQFVDKSVPIIYDPNDPKKFILKNEEGFSYAVFIIFIIVGLMFIGISISWMLGYLI